MNIVHTDVIVDNFDIVFAHPSTSLVRSRCQILDLQAPVVCWTLIVDTTNMLREMPEETNEERKRYLAIYLLMRSCHITSSKGRWCWSLAWKVWRMIDGSTFRQLKLFAHKVQ